MKTKWMSLIPITCVGLSAIPAATLTSCSKDDNNKIQVIVDTDVGNDCDDIGALSILGNAYKKNIVDIKAVTVCNRALTAIHTTDLMLEQYGIDCPLGEAENDQRLPFGDNYARYVDDAYTARSEKNPARIQSATKVLRKALSEANGKKIKLITLGMLNNIDNLIKSGPDEISDKTGKQLLEENVSEMVLMGGRFDAKVSEFNMEQARDAAVNVINHTSVPKTFVGWEVGYQVFTGSTFYASSGSPQKLAYDKYNDGQLRQSWDPITMYVALIDCWAYSQPGNVEVQLSEESKAYTIFTQSGTGNCRYVLQHPNSQQIADELETWMTVNI